MGRRSDHSRDQLRTMALAAAREIVHEDGLSGLSARKVAAKIGYTVGTLYLIFENLDELILHMNAATLDDLHDWLHEDSRRYRKAESRLLALAHSYIRFASEYPNLWVSVFEHRLPEDHALPEWFSDKVDGLFTLVEDALRPLVERKDSEVRLAARALWSGVHGICGLGMTGKLRYIGVEDVKNLADSLIKNYLVGYAAGK